MKVISSRDNPQYKMWRKIAESARAIDEFGYFLLSGTKLVQEALQMPTLDIRAEIITEDMRPFNMKSCYRLPHSLFKKLDVLGTDFNLLLIKTPQFEHWCETDRVTGMEVICPLGDPRNLGALVRSCVAFGVKTIILTKEACHPFLPAATKAASLACLKVTFKQGPSLSELKGPLVALDLQGCSLPQFHAPSQFRFLVGQEGLGLKKLSQDAIVERVTIATESVESLNATVAASIALHHFYQRHHAK
jgi:TrmH family RNA methyltransferase